MKKKLISGVCSVTLTLTVALSLHTSAQLRVGRLGCEYKTNPLGIEVATPHLSWQLSSPRQGVVQTAYRIVVSPHPASVKGDGRGADLWDSGVRTTDSSIQVPYGGPKLLAATMYYWKVEVWDNKGDSAWSDMASWQTGFFTPADWQGARWIAYNRMADSERILPGDRYDKKQIRNDTLPLLRHGFRVRKKIKRATVFVSGLGQFVMYLNGKKVGDHFLDPAWTDYEKEASYVTFDVTGQVRKGKNAVGVMLGNGFYYIPEVRHRYRKLMVQYGYPKMICLLKLTYTDGTTEYVGSDTSWKAAPGPVVFSSEYGGEDYDARAEQPGWDRPGFDDGAWRHAVAVKGPALHAQIEGPVKVFEHFSPRSIRRAGDGGWVYDLGQNASAVPFITVRGGHGNRGDSVRIIPSEVVAKNGSADQRGSGRPSWFTYILKGKGKESWHPRFSYYGFRYLEVKGAVPKGKPNPGHLPVIEKIEGLHMRNAAARSGSFWCSDTLFNRIDKLIDWAIQSNMMSLFTDCPHREKLGWLEQVNLMGNSVHYDYHIANLLRRTIVNMEDAQTSDGLVPEIAPEYVKFGKPFRDSPEWGSSSIIAPWYMYKWYGDERTLRESYPMMTRYMAYLATRAQDHILSYGLSDWYDLGPNRPGFAQLTPMGVTATATWYYDLTIMQKAAQLLGRTEDVHRYRETAAAVRRAFNDKFFHPDTKQYATGSQTANAMAVYLGLVNPADKQAVVNNIVTDIRSRNNSLTSGDIGYRYLLKALDEAGRADVIYDMNARTDVPGYGYQLAHGATALAESWQAYPSSSNDHFMLGHLMEWLYDGLGGISQQDTSVAFHTIRIAPEPVGDITSADVSFQCPYGKILSSWEKKQDGFTLTVEIPANASAVIGVPASPGQAVYRMGKDGKRTAARAAYRDGRAWVSTGSGRYVFSTR